MPNRNRVPQLLVVLAALTLPTTVFHAQGGAPPAVGAQGAPPAGAPRAGGAARGGLAPTEPQAPEEGMAEFPVPPQGYDVARENIPHGELKLLEYDSKTLGTRRPLRVYTPPGYSASRKYPVLYIQHALGNTSTEWTQRAKAPIIADNLLADGKLQPMVIVFPAGNATATAGDRQLLFAMFAAFGQSMGVIRVVTRRWAQPGLLCSLE